MSKIPFFIGIFLLSICCSGFAEDANQLHATPYVRSTIERTPKEQNHFDFERNSEHEEVAYFGVVIPEHYYHIIRVSNLFDVIYTHNEAKWEVNKNDRWKVKTWSPEDIILITQNTGCLSCYSNYPYRMINTTDSSEIEVDLKLGPLYDGNYTRWAAGLDIRKRLVVLDNGSRWKVDHCDYSILKKWYYNDTIIVGINSNWCASTKNILMNVETGSFVRANQE